MRFHSIDVDCGPLKGIKDGELIIVDGRTTFGANVKYTCAENYTLVGASKRVCATEGNWEPEEPKCLCMSKFHIFIFFLLLLL